MRTFKYTAGLGRQIRQARQTAGLSQATTATKAGMHQGDLSLLERDLVQPEIPTLCRLAKVLGADWGYDGRRIVFRRK